MTNLTIFTPVIALAALLLTGLVAARNRSLFPPRLDFQFRVVDRLPPRSPRKLKKEPVALALTSEDTNTPLTESRFPLILKNNSRRRIGEVGIEMMYPTAYFISNEEQKKLAKDALAKFPQRKELIDLILDQLSRRSAVKMGELVHVEYEVGPLRPGESRVFHEAIRVPAREAAFADPRFKDKLFGKILDLLSDVSAIRGLCHVRARILSDLNKPVEKHIDVLICHSTLENLPESVLRPYSNAHWLNEEVKGRYFKAFPIIPSYWRPMTHDRPVDVVFTKMTYDTAKTDDGYEMLVWDDVLNSVNARSWVRLPGYAYYHLPRQIPTVDHALMTIGYGRMPFPRKRKKVGGR